MVALSFGCDSSNQIAGPETGGQASQFGAAGVPKDPDRPDNDKPTGAHHVDITKESGDGQSVPAGSVAAQPLGLYITTNGGTFPLANTRVDWSVQQGSAVLSSYVTYTDLTGRTSVTLTAGNTAGPVNVQTMIPDHSMAAFNLTVVPGPVTNVVVAPASQTLQFGTTHQFTATAHDGYGNTVTNAPFTWTSTQPSVASVSASGLVTANAQGSATIRAQSGSATGQGTVTVTAPPTPGTVTDLTVPGTAGSSVTLRFTQVGDGLGNPADYQVRYRVNSGGHWGTATVVQSGSCRFPLEGTSVGSPLVCTVEGLASSVEYAFQLVAFRGQDPNAVFGGLSNIAIASTTAPISATALVVVSGNNQTAAVDTQAPAPLVVRAVTSSGAGVPNVIVNWTIPSGAASVSPASTTTNSNGEASTQVTMGTAAGPVTVRATASGLPPADFSLTSTAGAISQITVTPATLTLEPNQSSPLTASAADSHGNPISGVTYQWVSLNTNVATVGSDGRVVSVSPGTATIEARSGGVTGSTQLTVSSPPPPPPDGNPGTVTDLAVTATTSSSATLRFTQVTDGIGGAANYHIRYRTDTAGGHWGNAIVVQNGSCAFPLQGTGVGLTLTCTVAGLAASTTYVFQLVAFRGEDGSMVFGGLSNTANGTTTAGTPQNNAPQTPSLTSVTAITSNSATLNGSTFADPDAGNTHDASQWQLDNDATFGTPVFDSGAEAAATVRNVTGLAPATQYYARVRYRDNNGAFSNYSPAVTFTTTPGQAAPNTPTVSVSGVGTTSATLNGSAFSDPNSGDTHSASQWQVDEAGGNYASPVFDSNTTTTALTSQSVSGLTASTSYIARVRYRDNGGNWSSYSSSTSFTTTGGSGGGSIRWSSNWTTSLGTSDAALTDGGRFNRRLCGGITDVAEIISGPLIGWNGPGNVMRIRRNGQRCTQVDANDADQNGNPLANPALGLTNGQSYYVRMYNRVDISSGYQGANHPVSINTLGNIQGVLWAPGTQMSPALPPNTYNPEMALDATSGQLSDAHWVPTTPLPTRTWFRHEWHVEIVQVIGTTATFRIHPRVYDMAGNLIRDDNSFHRHPGWGNPTQTLAQFYAAGGLFRFDDIRLSHNFGVGYEGPAGASDTGEYWYHAAVAIGINGWVGP